MYPAVRPRGRFSCIIPTYCGTYQVAYRIAIVHSRVRDVDRMELMVADGPRRAVVLPGAKATLTAVLEDVCNRESRTL